MPTFYVEEHILPDAGILSPVLMQQTRKTDARGRRLARVLEWSKWMIPAAFAGSAIAILLHFTDLLLWRYGTPPCRQSSG